MKLYGGKNPSTAKAVPLPLGKGGKERKHIELPRVRVTLARFTEARLNMAIGMAAVMIALPICFGCYKAGEYFATKDMVVETKAAQVEVADYVPVEEPAVILMTEREQLGIGIYVVSGGLNKSDYVLTMIGDVIRNRVYSNSYPNTYAEVLTQPAQFGALAKTGCVWPMNATDEQKAKAMSIADKVLDGEQLLPRDCVYVSNTAIGETVAMLEGLYFGR